MGDKFTGSGNGGYVKQDEQILLMCEQTIKPNIEQLDSPPVNDSGQEILKDT